MLQKVNELQDAGNCLVRSRKNSRTSSTANRFMIRFSQFYLIEAVSSKRYALEKSFSPILTSALSVITTDKKLIAKIAYGMSVMDKDAEIQRNKKGNIIYDKDSKDTEFVGFEEDIAEYMRREVLPYVPDAKAFFEENLGAKKPVIKTEAKISFTRTFYKYQVLTASEKLENRFVELEEEVTSIVQRYLASGGKV